ncbi:lipoate--protein ligase family protein [Nesterenkonia sp. NBAIMH1]|uniref:lipoate--protein ligase family protein n=1 Tax=Nesterenkonia sp. NBAIMH1 TaxID=2600320 RepID=UPI0011B38CB9|nr:lipoate--protein ligase family protein [Nesterenkonia sp. NBAIMH1]
MSASGNGRSGRRSTPRGPQLQLIRQTSSLGAEADLQRALDLLQSTREPGVGPMLRIYRPQPTVAFGQRDAKLPGFEEAARRSRALGFEPLVRRAGGRAAAYSPGSLVVDHIEPDADPIRESRDRFVAFGELFADALQNAGLDAVMAPLPAEYCYGDHSVHGIHPDQADVRLKLVGTAQRQVASGWLFSTSIVIEDGPRIRRVLAEVYDALGLEWDPLTAGSADELNPDLTVYSVEQAILETYSTYWNVLEPIG